MRAAEERARSGSNASEKAVEDPPSYAKLAILLAGILVIAAVLGKVIPAENGQHQPDKNLEDGIKPDTFVIDVSGSENAITVNTGRGKSSHQGNVIHFERSVPDTEPSVEPNEKQDGSPTSPNTVNPEKTLRQTCAFEAMNPAFANLVFEWQNEDTDVCSPHELECSADEVSEDEPMMVTEEQPEPGPGKTDQGSQLEEENPEPKTELKEKKREGDSSEKLDQLLKKQKRGPNNSPSTAPTATPSTTPTTSSPSAAPSANPSTAPTTSPNKGQTGKPFNPEEWADTLQTPVNSGDEDPGLGSLATPETQESSAVAESLVMGFSTFPGQDLGTGFEDPLSPHLKFNEEIFFGSAEVSLSTTTPHEWSGDDVLGNMIDDLCGPGTSSMFDDLCEGICYEEEEAAWCRAEEEVGSNYQGDRFLEVARMKDQAVAAPGADETSAQPQILEDDHDSTATNSFNFAWCPGSPPFETLLSGSDEELYEFCDWLCGPIDGTGEAQNAPCDGQTDPETLTSTGASSATPTKKWSYTEMHERLEAGQTFQDRLNTFLCEESFVTVTTHERGDDLKHPSGSYRSYIFPEWAGTRRRVYRSLAHAQRVMERLAKEESQGIENEQETTPTVDDNYETPKGSCTDDGEKTNEETKESFDCIDSDVVVTGPGTDGMMTLSGSSKEDPWVISDGESGDEDDISGHYAHSKKRVRFEDEDADEQKDGKATRPKRQDTPYYAPRDPDAL